MKRIAFLTIVLALTAGAAPAQRPAPGEGESHNENLGAGIYSVNWGTMGLNVGVSSGPDGILLVDAQDEPAVPRLKTELAKISNAPVRIIINTHWHGDHVGANAEFSKLGAVTIAQTNTRTRLMTDQVHPLTGARQRAFAPAFWPQVTFEDSLTLHFNGDDIEVLYIKDAHTDSDVIVRFKKANVLFAADLFNNGDYTRIDPRGGSLDNMIAAYQTLLPTLNDQVKVVPGRGKVGTKKDLEDYLQAMITLRDRIGRLISEGKSVEEAIALKPTADLDAKWANGPIRPEHIVAEVYADLKKRR